jgi:two-component system chemotaxis sensor kinase CheA
MDEIIEEFLAESHENLDRLDREFLELESDPGSAEILAGVFRTIHTIKGTSGFLGFSNLEHVAHAGENLLSLLREGSLDLTPPRTTALLQMVDAIREMLAYVGTDGTDGGATYDDVVAELDHWAAGDAPESDAGDREDTDPPADTPRTEVIPAIESSGDEAVVTEPTPAIGTPVADAGDVAPPDAPRRPQAPPETSIRVDLALLDDLMTLVGELVLARNQVLQTGTGVADPSFTHATQQLDLITSELQENVMKTRMQPVGGAFGKLPRIVRDLAQQLGKEVRLEIHGEETELDRSVLEAIRDPLTHLVRNAVDHGLETAVDRAANGKSAVGSLRVSAHHEGGQVNIEICDDGAGIDVDRIKQVALERRIVNAEKLSAMGEREIFGLIFHPGFSTAAEVTNISGRGVGMDVVRTNIEQIGGSLDITSKRGEGTTFVIRIPLTLAIIPALVVRCAEQRFAIPQLNLVELVRVEGKDVSTQIEWIGCSPVMRLRGALLPLLHLAEVLEVGEACLDGSASLDVVVLQAGETQFGLVVEAVQDSGEIVVKPLGRHLRDQWAFSGTTIMGDGSVALILDVLGLAQHHALAVDAEVVADHIDQSTGSGASDAISLLLCRVGDQKVALPLSIIDRLEVFPAAAVTSAAGREVLHYRERLVEVVRLDDYVGRSGGIAEDGAELSALIIAHGGEVTAMVVDQILEVATSDLAVHRTSERPPVALSTVIGGEVVDLVDVDALITMAAGSPAAIMR